MRAAGLNPILAIQGAWGGGAAPPQMPRYGDLGANVASGIKAGAEAALTKGKKGQLREDIGLKRQQANQAQAQKQYLWTQADLAHEKALTERNLRQSYDAQATAAYAQAARSDQERDNLNAVGQRLEVLGNLWEENPKTMATKELLEDAIKALPIRAR